ncbi:LysR family transcriptional regulator, partial [Acidaminococcus timonensis]
MDFKELTYVLAIARHQNITRAAEALHLTQPIPFLPVGWQILFQQID